MAEQPLFLDGQRQIDQLASENDACRAWLDDPESQRDIDYKARSELWEVVEGLYTTEEMRLMHPAYYDRFLSPAAEAREHAIGEAIERYISAEYQGQLAEERFYAEQDPDSEWYRADLYHGHPGPDRESPEARQARLYDAWEMSDAGIAAQDREIARFERVAHPSQEASETDTPGVSRLTPIEVDTSNEDMGQGWQAQLEALSQRLAELEAWEPGQDQQHERGVGY